MSTATRFAIAHKLFHESSTNERKLMRDISQIRTKLNEVKDELERKQHELNECISLQTASQATLLDLLQDVNFETFKQLIKEVT